MRRRAKIIRGGELGAVAFINEEAKNCSMSMIGAVGRVAYLGRVTIF